MRLEVSALTVSYPGRVVVSGFDAVVPHGEIGVLVGPSGSGKSTVLAVLAGLKRPDSGTVRYLDGGGRDAPPRSSQVAWIPQGLGVIGARSVLDNVAIGALSRGVGVRRAESLALRCLDRVGLVGRAGEPCGRLSGGELQRVALARALATERQILFADEPTSNLDAANTRMVIDALTGLRGRVTVVVATHDPAVQRASPHVFGLRAGDDRAR